MTVFNFWIKLLLAWLAGQSIGSVVVWASHGGMPPTMVWLSILAWAPVIFLLGYRTGRTNRQSVQ